MASFNTSKVDGNTVSASEYNQLAEVNNFITNTGQTPSTANLQQMGIPHCNVNVIFSPHAVRSIKPMKTSISKHSILKVIDFMQFISNAISNAISQAWPSTR